MTTNETRLREIIEDRWRMVATDVRMDDYAPAGPHPVNSEAMQRLVDTLAYMAGRMVEDVFEHEEAAWETLQSDLLEAIEAKIKAYAIEVETGRSKPRAVAAS